MGYFPIPIYTLVHIPWAVSPAIESHSIHTSIIQKLPKRGQRSFNSRRMGKRRRSLRLWPGVAPSSPHGETELVGFLNRAVRDSSWMTLVIRMGWGRL